MGYVSRDTSPIIGRSISRKWEKYLSKRSPLKHTCSWHDKLIVSWKLRWVNSNVLNNKIRLKLTIENILSFSWGFFVSSAWSSWFTGDKQETSTLVFCVVKPLYGQIFNCNCRVDIGSEAKMWKSVQNSIFHWKNEVKSFGDIKYIIFLANNGHL